MDNTTYMFTTSKSPSPILAVSSKDGTELSTLGSIKIGIPASSQSGNQSENRSSISPHPISRSDTIASYDRAYIRVCITMPSQFGWRSWRSYEAAIESLAVGIYLYATFVMTSILFLNADKAIWWATVMTTCLSGVRIFATLF
ncbi:hypothetical protein BDV96DRAFT_576267 [Lophiotrema nucula]|uniref:Uncharacterized protein n=1 Tax=Lophiotrema nucula TaxID=690887 RepID=A0A6A5Z7G3_9PLEO|nr:hypothetical protein BDV96DRAFT_576267 [Lophiotrema nucula]